MNISQSVVEIEDCDQCGLPATKEIFPYTNEYIKKCSSCGNVTVKGVNKISKTKGYGSLFQDGHLFIFHHPIDFVEEHKVLKSIADNKEAVFLKWSEENNSLIAVQGELPKSLEEIYQEQCEHLKNEKEYYESFESIRVPSEMLKPFSNME